jgi:hypothetical protein
MAVCLTKALARVRPPQRRVQFGRPLRHGRRPMARFENALVFRWDRLRARHRTRAWRTNSGCVQRSDVRGRRLPFADGDGDDGSGLRPGSFMGAASRPRAQWCAPLEPAELCSELVRSTPLERSLDV